MTTGSSKKSIKLKGELQKSSGKSGKTSCSKSSKVKGGNKSSNSKSKKESSKSALSKSANAHPCTSKKSFVFSKSGTGKSKTSSVSKSLNSSKPSSSGSAKKDSKFFAKVDSKFKVYKTKIKNKRKVNKSNQKETSSSSKSGSGKKSTTSSRTSRVKYKSKRRDSKLYRCIESYQAEGQKIFFNAFIGEPITTTYNKDQLDIVIFVDLNCQSTKNIPTGNTALTSPETPSKCPLPPPTTISSGMSIITPTYCGSSVRPLMTGPNRTESSAGVITEVVVSETQAKSENSE